MPVWNADTVTPKMHRAHFVRLHLVRLITDLEGEGRRESFRCLLQEGTTQRGFKISAGGEGENDDDDDNDEHNTFRMRRYLSKLNRPAFHRRNMLVKY